MYPANAKKRQRRWLGIHPLIGLFILPLALASLAGQTLIAQTVHIHEAGNYRQPPAGDDRPQKSRRFDPFIRQSAGSKKAADSDKYVSAESTNPTGVIDIRAKYGVTAKPSPKAAAELAQALKHSTGSNGADDSKRGTPLDNILDALHRGVKSLQALKRLLPKDWTGIPTRKGNGLRYADPARRGDQIRFMRGNPNDPNPVKQGPYVRISKDGRKFGPFPLEGNPTLQ